MKNNLFQKKVPLLAALALLCAGTAIPSHANDPSAFHIEPQKEFTVPKIDAAVEAVMLVNGSHSAALAIVKDTRLVYAKGYTTTEIPAYPKTLPTTYFRQASVSKLFTSIATFQLIQEGKLTLDTTMQSVLQAKGLNGRPPSPDFDKITVQNLLEMDSGIEPYLPWRDVAATQFFGTKLPATTDQLVNYAAAEEMISKPGDKSQAFYNNSDYLLLGQVVAKKRGAAVFIRAIEGPLLAPLHMTRIREARSLLGQQFSDEPYYWYVLDKDDPNSEARSVMTPDQPMVHLGYGDMNMENAGGAGGLSGAVTDVARVLAALSVRENNPMLHEDTIRKMLSRAAADDADPAFSHKDDQGKSDAFGFYGLDSVKEEDKNKGLYLGDKGGYLSTSQNGIYFERGGLSYVICWDSHTPAGEHWYPVFQSVLDAARQQDWGKTDLFPKYGMPSFSPTPVALLARPGLLRTLPARNLKVLARPPILPPVHVK